ncbi:MAG TPA: YciI family protein [Amycolatopsis sp.]|nr:YciI family protein [Amycolatopsis sp.]
MDTDRARPDERHSGAQKVVFLCFTEPVHMSAEEMRPHLAEHKAWLGETERAGSLLFAGPVLDDDYHYSGSGLLVIQAGSLAEAQSVADADPFHAKGIRKYKLLPWQINEGAFDVRLSLSDGRFTFS